MIQSSGGLGGHVSLAHLSKPQLLIVAQGLALLVLGVAGLFAAEDLAERTFQANQSRPPTGPTFVVGMGSPSVVAVQNGTAPGRSLQDSYARASRLLFGGLLAGGLVYLGIAAEVARHPLASLLAALTCFAGLVSAVFYLAPERPAAWGLPTLALGIAWLQCRFLQFAIGRDETFAVQDRTGKTPSHPLVRWSLAHVLVTLAIVVLAAGLKLANDNVTGSVEWGAASTQLLLKTGMQAIVIAAVAAWIGLPPADGGSASPRRQAAVWLAFVASLAAMIGVNCGYSLLLEQYIGLPIPVGARFPVEGLVWVSLIVATPAVTEELLYRYLGFGWLRTRLGPHASIWVTAVAFGTAHALYPLGIPYVVLLGAWLGYARWLSGGIVLPIALHVLHNAVLP